MGVAEGNVGLAFGLTIIAGACTGLGALLPFCMDIKNPKLLAIALGISGGVMLYVSLIEIFFKSVVAFELVDNVGPDHAYTATTSCFFGGIIITLLVNWIVHKLDPDHTHIVDVKEHRDVEPTRHSSSEEEEHHEVSLAPLREERRGRRKIADSGGLRPNGVRRARGRARRNLKSVSSTELVEAHSSDKLMELEKKRAATRGRSKKRRSKAEAVTTKKKDNEDFEDIEIRASTSTDEEVVPVVEDLENPVDAQRAKRLKRAGLMTALSIGLHNLPEGLVTFIAALADSKLGIAMAVAIGIHNIPEGICVAVPIYYATGSRVRGFLWSILSGVSEPLGALLGYLVLANSESNEAYAILFGIISGIMSCIVIRELLPTARMYDHHDHMVSFSVFAGMAIMALSLVLFAEFG